ncbi:MAG: cobalt-precorrin-6A reductase [Rhizobiaceae bacterium]|nr:MAG: cobalt-precorrin-6A reductase [Rhizobiaceae bacterium]
MTTHRILILGGTTEARLLAERLAARPDLDTILSLAGRTRDPVSQPVPVRVGGFGGAEGLAHYLTENGVGILIDATHPFATRISANAAIAARQAGVPAIALRRPEWRSVQGDRWTIVKSVEEGVAALGEQPRRVFVTLGRQELAPLANAPQHVYLIRSVDPVEPPPDLPHAGYLLARGPFSEAAEHDLLRAQRIDAILAKNSGGDATYGKIAAARSLGIGIVMIRRPTAPDMPTATTVEEALLLLDHRLASPAKRGV